MAMFLSIGLSPDQKTLAGSSGYLPADNEDVIPEDRALFLMDLTGLERPVQRISLPVPAFVAPKGR